MVIKHLLNEDKVWQMSRIFKGMNCAGTIQKPDALFICAKAKRQQQLR
ncbi:hypothetical protein [Lysinibacillus pakistanensis]|nr:hypothetical protein [Lysinibacillus pakistanensis]